MADCCKVGRVVEKYAISTHVPFDTVDEYLIRRWNGDGMQAVGVRKLADWLNKEILKETYDRADITTLDSRIEADYETLQSDDKSERESLKIEMQQNEIPIAEVIDDYVSGPTIYRHLKNCLDTDKEEQRMADWERDRINYHRKQLVKGVQDAFGSLRNKDKLSFTDPLEVSVSVYVSDGESESEVQVDRVLNRGYVSEDNES